MRVIAALSALCALSPVLAVVGPGKVTGSTDVHDPTICKDNNNKYFLYATAVGISIRTSTDRNNWKYEGVVWPNGAAWTAPYTGSDNANLWAPDCSYINNQFRLFYSASSFGSSKSAIFLATSKTGMPGSWTNAAKVIETSASSGWNAIDPNLVIVDNRWYLSMGSFWSGIKFSEITSAGAIKGSLGSLAKRGSAAGGAVEASTIFQYGSYYYLFTSWDKCCSGTSSTYNIRVGRSSAVGGPYVDQANAALTNGGGTLVLGTHDGIYGPGGADVFQDGDGPILVYHYYTSQGSFLGINKLDFSTGWPVVA